MEEMPLELNGGHTSIMEEQNKYRKIQAQLDSVKKQVSHLLLDFFTHLNYDPSSSLVL